MTNILDASTRDVAPYSTTNLTMTLSCISIDFDRQGHRELERDPKRHRARRRSTDPHSIARSAVPTLR